MGEALNKYPWEENNIFPIVWFEGKLYNALIKPETHPRIDRVCLTDFYYPENKPYWVTADRIFNIIKI